MHFHHSSSTSSMSSLSDTSQSMTYNIHITVTFFHLKYFLMYTLFLFALFYSFLSRTPLEMP